MREDFFATVQFIRMKRYKFTQRLLQSFKWYLLVKDRPCGLVVTVPGYRSRGLGSIPGFTRFL
jgi:hypothetical protein